MTAWGTNDSCMCIFLCLLPRGTVVQGVRVSGCQSDTLLHYSPKYPFILQEYTFNVREDLGNGGTIGQVSANDIDSGEFGTIIYGILPGYTDIFFIHEDTVCDYIYGITLQTSPTIRFNKPPACFHIWTISTIFSIRYPCLFPGYYSTKRWRGVGLRETIRVCPSC